MLEEKKLTQDFFLFIELSYKMLKKIKKKKSENIFKTNCTFSVNSSELTIYYE